MRGRPIEAADLPFARSASRRHSQPFSEWIASLPPDVDLRAQIVEVEKALVARALATSDDVAAQAARKLGLSRSDLAYKLRRLDVARKS